MILIEFPLSLQIYRMADMLLLQKLSSHGQPIKQLVFSPWPLEGPESNPMVLVSLSEQMCFWNIKYVINNPLDARKKKGVRRSSRFTKDAKWEFSGEMMATNDNEVNENGNGNGNGTTAIALNGKHGKVGHGQQDFWEDKTGASDKPELLACIKFVGNSATKLVTNAEFNRFITIDNEGDIYALQTTNPAINSSSDASPERESPTSAAAVTRHFGRISLGNNLTVSS